MRVAELLVIFRKNFAASGGDPDSCPGLQWAELVVPQHPEWTLQHFADKVALRKNHDYLLHGLQHCWDELTETQRMIYLVHLADINWLKPVLKYQDKFTNAEADFIGTKLRESGSKVAVGEMERKRTERDG